MENPKLLAQAPTTVIFHGPHTYVTPKWYAKNNVPTWNYSAVHVTGSVELIEDHAGLLECLKELSSHAERHWPSGWEFFIPDDLADPNVLVRSIVGFKIKVNDINYKKKLHQKSTPVDRAGVLRGLEGRSDNNSHEVLAEMQKMYSTDGEKR
jgi:transcriptional regulator